ncbi:hypothetical protein L1987_60380 [Smallanthus sonchifolius]|uniref:Uncharacterized protein n=1 Tax=Smallanthus sonchifolius TaxID=185202 RepID=A0ACB9D7Y7_9ASTR|nr:hypothetical protein L1987_60380 [Smallanthus sonchifolius]
MKTPRGTAVPPQPSQRVRAKSNLEMEGTVFGPALEGMKHVKSEEGEMLTKPFLDVCKQILPVIDKFGAAMALVKTDVGGNITIELISMLNVRPSF